MVQRRNVPPAGARTAPDGRYANDPIMRTESQPATREQVGLLVGLSSLTALPLLTIVMVYVTGHQTAPDHAPAWRAFAIALAAGAFWGLVFVRFVPLFGGALPGSPSVRTVLAILAAVSLIVVEVIGRVAHQALPVTMGFIAGTDSVLAIVLLIRSLRRLSEIATTPR
ncbi:MAG TPA: hypothetical protein VJT14_00325 [Candidatus Dormibacteraeota bacterium]|nr:hypothetical protein [Candidatus Dormibacteraeota bacterium]